MISVIDMPPPDESIWWRGKRGFEVGFFPCECVEVIGDKVPQGLNLPMGATTRLRKNSMGSEDPDETNDGQNSSKGSPTSSSEPTKPVLRKHGKLISFFRSFILSRPSRGNLRKSGILKERVFGCDLSEHLLNTGQDVPKVLTHCAEFIEARGIIDGIYRLSGIASNIQKLRVAFDEDRVPNLYDDRGVLQDIHSVSSLLKMYFRELPNPVCTYHLYDKFVEAAKAAENQRLVMMRDVVQQLPPPNYRTLEYLARHLYRVSLRGHDTGMTAKNVAIVWAPNLLRAKMFETGGVAALQGVGVQAVVTEYLIRYCELIFSDKMPSYNSSSNPSATINEDAAAASKKSRPKSLAISTPTKLLSLEEARNRVHNLGQVGEAPPQKYIEVGGGPKSLPQKYHTVIDLPGRRSMKQRKSPIGWKAIFKSKTNKNGRTKADIDLITNNGQYTSSTVTEADLRAAMPRQAMLRPVKSAESLVTAANVQRSQSERRTSKTEAGLEAAATSALAASLLDNDRDDQDLSSSNELLDKSLMESSDDLCPLEAVSKAVASSNVMKDSPRTHARSNSHDSYFERKLQRQLKNSSNDSEEKTCENDEASSAGSSKKRVRNNKMDSSLDLSEIQVNFDLEENEMKIFSEDEAMMTNSFDSGEDDFTRSPLEEEGHQEPLLKAEEAMETTTTASTLNSSSAVSPKGRKMSFREKFKRFTSPTQNRKEINSGETESSSEGGRGDTPPRELKSQNYHKNASSSKTEGMTLRERIACALSPESLRKRDNHNQNESSPKKKKSSFSPGTSPNNTSQLIKRSKISQEIEHEMTSEVTKEAVEAAEVAGNGKALALPLSPSINFIDASMTESFESATIIKNRNSSDIISRSSRTAAPLDTTAAPATLPNSQQDQTCQDSFKTQNPRLSTTSSGAGESDQELQLNQLVVAQVHHDPILEMPSVEDKETDSLEVENIKKDEMTAMTTGTTTNETSEAENNTESYSIAGATISENESFSLASYELDGLMPTTYSTTQQSSNLLPEIEAAAFNQEQQLVAAYDNTMSEPGQIRISPEEKSGFNDAEIEAIQSKPMLPVNHVIQYSPRTSAASAPDWTASVQLYNNQNSQDQTSRDSFKLVQTSSDLSETQFQIEEEATADNENKIDIPEPMEIDTIITSQPTSVSENEQKCDEKAKIIDQTADQNINDLNDKHIIDSDLEEAEVQKNLVKSPHENQQRESFSCPLYPHKTIASLLVTTTEVQVQLDHDQNLNSAGAPSTRTLPDIKGDINIPPIQQAAPQLDAAAGTVLVHNSAAAALGATAGAAGASGSSPPVTPTGSTRSKTPSPRPRSSVAKQNSTNMDTTETSSTAASNDSAASINDNAAPNKSSRGPVPTPRKSVTMMECEDPSSNTPVPVRSNSAMGNRQIHKKISFSNTHMPVAKKLSTFSLHEMHHNTISIEEDSGSDSEAEQPLQRRNSIHNVPYVDVSDPQTRERMERYKEERRSMLRAKYKAEDYMTSTASEVGNKYRRKSTESQQSNKIEQTSSETSPPPPQNEPPYEPPCSTSPVILRKDVQGGLPKMSSPLREDGLIDEDVNVKERAAIFGGTGCQNHNLNNQNETVKQNHQNASQVILPPKYNRSKSMWTNSNTTSSSAKVIKPPRPISDDPSSNNGTSRKISPGSPSKIRDMAAFFEQHQKN